MNREQIIDVITTEPTTVLYSLFELVTKEEGTALIHLLEEKPLGSNIWTYVTKNDLEDFQTKDQDHLIRVVNGKDIVSLRVIRDSMLSRRKKL